WAGGGPRCARRGGGAGGGYRLPVGRSLSGLDDDGAAFHAHGGIIRHRTLRGRRQRPVDSRIMARYHFSGVAGVGMSPLAQLMRARGHVVQGSDRALDAGKSVEVGARLRALGITLVPQDGRATTADLDRFVYSSAVEAETPEMRAARIHGLECIPRPALL